MKTEITAQETIDFLNELIDLDKEAIQKLILHRVHCNEKIAKHPTVQVNGYTEEEMSVGFLGILNGLFGGDDSENNEYISAIFDRKENNPEDYELVKFEIQKISNLDDL